METECYITLAQPTKYSWPTNTTSHPHEIIEILDDDDDDDEQVYETRGHVKLPIYSSSESEGNNFAFDDPFPLYGNEAVNFAANINKG